MANTPNPQDTEAWLRQAMATPALKPHPNQHPNVAPVEQPDEHSSNVVWALSDLAQVNLLNNVAHIPGESNRDWVQQDRRDVWIQTTELLQKKGYRVAGVGVRWSDIQEARQIFNDDDRDALNCDGWIGLNTLLKRAKESGQTEVTRFDEPHAFLLYNPHHAEAQVLQEFLEFIAPNPPRARHTLLLMPTLKPTAVCLDEGLRPLMEEAEGRLALLKARYRSGAMAVALDAAFETTAPPRKVRM